MAFDAFPCVSKQYSLIDYQLEMRYSVCIFVIHLVLENRLLLLVTHGRYGPQLLWSPPHNYCPYWSGLKSDVEIFLSSPLVCPRYWIYWFSPTTPAKTFQMHLLKKGIE